MLFSQSKTTLQRMFLSLDLGAMYWTFLLNDSYFLVEKWLSKVKLALHDVKKSGNQCSGSIGRTTNWIFLNQYPAWYQM